MTDRIDTKLSGAFAKDVSEEAFLAELNKALVPFEERCRGAASEEQFATLHVTGAPRSGTTLLTQAVAGRLDVAPVANLAAAFWEAPCVGLRLAKKLLPRETPRRFESAVAGTSTVGGAHLPADRFPSVPAPEIEWLTSEATPDGWHLVVRVRSRRAADILGIAFDAELLSARANTAEVPTIREGRMRRSRGLVLLRWESVSAEAVLFDLRLAGAPPPMLTVYDQSHALPDSAAAIFAARGDSARPKGYGDAWVASRTLAIPRSR